MGVDILMPYLVFAIQIIITLRAIGTFIVASLVCRSIPNIQVVAFTRTVVKHARKLVISFLSEKIPPENVFLYFIHTVFVKMMASIPLP